MDTRTNHHNRRRIVIALGGAVAVSVVGAAIAVADSNPPSLAPPVAQSVSVEQPGLAAWARANGLTGLSPAGLTVAPVRSASAGQSEVAAWARANGLTGLSPASLRRIDD